MWEAELVALKVTGEVIAFGIAIFLPLVLARILMMKYPKFDQWVKGIWPNEKQKELLWVVVPIAIVLFLLK